MCTWHMAPVGAKSGSAAPTSAPMENPVYSLSWTPAPEAAAVLHGLIRLIAALIAGFTLVSLIVTVAYPPLSAAAGLARPGTALFLLFGATSLWLHLPTAPRRRWRKPLAALAGVMVLIGITSEYSGWGHYFGFTSPIVVATATLVTLSLLLLERPGWLGRLSWLGANAILAFALFVLIDYLYAFQAEAYRPVFAPVSLGGALAYTGLGLGLLLANVRYLPASALSSQGPGGLMARRMLVPGVTLPLLLLLLLRLAVRNDLTSLDMGYSVVTWALIVSLAVLICQQAATLNRLAAQARGELAEAEAGHLRRIGLAADAAEVFLWELDPQTGLVFPVEPHMRHLGYRPEDVQPTMTWWLSLIHPDDLGHLNAMHEQLLQQGSSDLHEIALRERHKNGEYRWMLTRAKVARRDTHGRPTAVFGVSIDITERRRMAQQLMDTKARLRLAMEVAAVGYWEQDLRSGRVHYSPQWKRLLGYADHELPDQPETLLSRLHPDDVSKAQAQMVATPTTGEPGLPAELRLRHKDGSYRWFLSRTVRAADTSGEFVRLEGVYLDITERKEIEKRIRQVSQHDPLTGLPNRSLFHEFAAPRLASAARNAGWVGVLFVDMDRFKPINDNYGHEVGDEVLKEIARRLRTSVRASDLVGRLGGDEFLVLLTDARSEEAIARAARVCLNRLNRPYRVGELELHTTPSIGISVFPRDGDDFDTLIRKADAAMYEAKHSGRNTFRFYRGEEAGQASEPLRSG